MWKELDTKLTEMLLAELGVGVGAVEVVVVVGAGATPATTNVLVLK